MSPDTHLPTYLFHKPHTPPAALHAWSARARKPVHYVWKGANPLAEMYSAFRAEVPVPGDASTGKIVDGTWRSVRLVRLVGRALMY